MVSHRVLLHGRGEGVVGDLQRQAAERSRHYIYRSLAFLEHSTAYDPLDFLFDGALNATESTTVVLDQLADIHDSALISEIADKLAIWSELSPEIDAEFYWTISSEDSRKAGRIAALLQPLMARRRGKR